MELFNGMFGKIENGMCRLSMNGGIAVKTSTGYKSYNPKTNKLTNCHNFVFNIGEEFFFLIPTNKVEKGDIILASGKPKCVIDVDKDTITAINYEDATVETILPERHVFMGNTYFYGKIVSMFGTNVSGKKGANQIMKYAFASEMMKGLSGNGGNGQNPYSSMLPFMMMGGDMGDVLGNIFDFTEDDGSEEESEE